MTEEKQTMTPEDAPGTTPATADAEPGYLDVPDEENPAIIEAHKTFVITMIGSALFIGSVLVFIL